MQRWFYGLAITLAAGSAAAQDTQQTPEGAHRFLSLITEQRVVKLNYARFRFPAFNVEYQARLAYAGDCATTLSGTPISYNPGNGWLPATTPQAQAKLATLLQRNSLKGPPFQIDWAQVGAVELVNGVTNDDANHPGQVVIIRIGDGLHQLLAPDQSTAKRIQYAMTFLKEHCDKTAETGF